MNEHSYVRSIHSIIKRDFPDLYVWKIHDTYAGGVPDAFYSGKYRYLFVEYKFLNKLPKRDTTLVDLTKPSVLSFNQQQWLHERHCHNISTAVIIGTQLGSVIMPDLTWQTPLAAQYFKNSRTTKDVAHWVANFCINRTKGTIYDLHHPQAN